MSPEESLCDDTRAKRGRVGPVLKLLVWAAALACGPGAALAEAAPAAGADLGTEGGAHSKGVQPKRAEIAVRGLGWIRDRRQRETLNLLLGSQRGVTLDASAIEDAALILYSGLADQGYMDPSITASVVGPDGSQSRFPLEKDLATPLPRSLKGVRVRFEIQTGKRFTIEEVELTGLAAIGADRARTYFRGEGILAQLTAERAYSPHRLQRSLGNLRDELLRLGYADVQVTADQVAIDHATGRVRLGISVRQGARWRVSSIDYKVADGGPSPSGIGAKRIGLPWSEWWRRDTETEIRRWYFARGYPDVRVTLEARTSPVIGGEYAVAALAQIAAGPLMRMGKIEFVGNTRTRESVLRPLVKAKPGAPLNPLVLQEGQYHLSRLGVFSSVDLQYQADGEGTRDAIYQLKDDKKEDVDLLLGWGTFDELRGGVEWRDYDLFGLAHEGTLKLVQAIKSTEGEYDYTIPELFGSSADGTAKVFGFDRHQRDFLDEQYGTTLSVATPLPGLGANLLTGYTFERLRAVNDTLATELTDLTAASATSVSAGLTRDRRDSPLEPRRGYKLFLQVEEASHWLGGQVDFQEVQVGASYHTQWGPSRWFHFGFSHSVISTYGAPAANVLPPNVLFYPGGGDSIRGYGLGEAAPRGADGQFVGARQTSLLNFELEQELTHNWSAVLFSDSLMEASSLKDYPMGDRLYSVGAGLSYQTIIGPIRLEYGRNLNPRPRDPHGTLQFSVGYPF